MHCEYVLAVRHRTLHQGRDMKTFAILTTAVSTLALGACTDQKAQITSPPEVVALKLETSAAFAGERSYRVTIENLTTGQVFSPGVIATHTNKVDVWSPGAAASEGVRLIAEDGMESVAVAELTGAPGVHAVISTLAPINRIGGPVGLPSSRSFIIGAAANANRLSVTVMLICTNDGFTGLHGEKLPGGFKAASYLVGAWDAGTEENNERFSQIVDPCQMAGPVVAPSDGNGRVATSGVILPHSNIQGIADLSVPLHGWQGPVARITVQRIK